MFSTTKKISKLVLSDIDRLCLILTFFTHIAVIVCVVMCSLWQGKYLAFYTYSCDCLCCDVQVVATVNILV